MTKREFNCPKCNKVLKDGEGERCGACEDELITKTTRVLRPATKYVSEISTGGDDRSTCNYPHCITEYKEKIRRGDMPTNVTKGDQP